MHLKIEFDNTVMKEIEKKLKDLHNTHTEWGWINEKTYPSGDIANRDNIKVAEIARINEYGGVSKSRSGKQPVRIPSRPYFRQALIQTEQKAILFAKAAFALALSNQSFDQILEKQARLAALDIVLSIRKQNKDPLHNKTIDIKGHAIQWMDTGVLMSNITFKVYKTNIDRAKIGGGLT